MVFRSFAPFTYLIKHLLVGMFSIVVSIIHVVVTLRELNFGKAADQ